MRLADVSYRQGSETWLYPLDLELMPGTINVLLGATLAGKTTLMRLAAGLDRPTTGRLYAGSQDVTGVPVRHRNLAMVYQQFINYPSLTVYENIASPLRLQGLRNEAIHARVASLAEALKLSPYLDKLPAELSGGQQQRTALARALAKQADLILLDEPLVNLDYKLREELRTELRQLFTHSQTTVVYATTEPHEALQLAGNTIVLAEGRLIQHGPTLEVFRRPASLAAARAFSDPPLNEFDASFDPTSFLAIAAGGLRLRLPRSNMAHAANLARIRIGIRAHQLHLKPSAQSVAFTGTVDLAEISGSETYVHVSHDGMTLVAQLQGVHALSLGETCTLHFDPADVYCFDERGSVVFGAETH